MNDFSNEPEIKDRVTLESQIGPQAHANMGTIANLTGDEVWIALGRPVEHLSSGTPVRVILHRPDGEIAAETTVRRLIGTSGRMAGLHRPQKWETHSRRSHGRVGLAIPAYLHSDTEGAAFPARTTNLSVGGFHCVTSLPISVGHQLEVSLMLTPTDLFRCRAQVVRLSDDPEDPTGRQLLVAFRFVDLDPIGEVRIAEALAALNEETDPAAVSAAWHGTGAPNQAAR